MPPTSPARRDTLVAFCFLAALAAVLALVALSSFEGRIGGIEFRVRYKELARTAVIAWMIVLLMPTLRRALPYHRDAADLPLFLFFVVAVLSVFFGGRHWGDVRNLWAAIGMGLIGRALFRPAARRPLFLHYLGATILLVLGHEVLRNPHVLLLNESGRYALVTGNANPLGFLFAMLAPLFLAEALTAGRVRAVVTAGYYVVAVAGTLITFSRSAALGLAVGTLVVLWSHPQRRRVLLLAPAGVLLFLAIQRPHEWYDMRAVGDADRLRILHTSMTLVIDEPLLGLGYGMSNLEERFPARFEKLYGRRAFFHHTGNQIVDILVGTGVLGLACLVWWTSMLLARAWRDVRPGSAHVRTKAAGHLAMLVAVVLMAMLEPPLGNAWLSMVLFLAVAYVRQPA